MEKLLTVMPARPRKPLYLTKSRFLAGLDCHKRLWLGFHQPAPYEDPEPGSISAIGIQVGQGARSLFPGGTLVDHKPWQHDQAIARTAELMADPKVPAIFEGAFEHDGVRIRADVLERLSAGRWALHEVKSSKEPKDTHLPDLAIQAQVIAGNDVDLTKVGLIHVNGDYERGPDGINWSQLLTKTDLTQAVAALIPGLPEFLATFFRVLGEPEAPPIEAGKHCPDYCEFWDRCTAGKPKDWIFRMPNLRVEKYQALLEKGFQRIGEVTDDQALSDLQTRIRNAHRDGTEFVSEVLAEALKRFGPPAYYLDFETLSPAIPVYSGTRPFQQIPFQWSIHRLDRKGELSHQDFLAGGHTDPRRPLAEALIKALGKSRQPIIVYTSFESRVISGLAKDLPDLAEPLTAILDRLQDLHGLIKSHFYHPDFTGSFSIKAVGPALAPDLSYEDLGDLAEGLAAAAAFYGLVTGQLGPDQVPDQVRAALLEYCKLDSLAMLRVHQALLDRVG